MRNRTVSELDSSVTLSSMPIDTYTINIINEEVWSWEFVLKTCLKCLHSISGYLDPIPCLTQRLGCNGGGISNWISAAYMGDLI